jgi:hypothetical protein
MEHAFTERRRSPRVSTEDGMIVALHVAVPVRVLELSPDGLRLGCRVPLRVGSTVRVVTRLAGRRLEVELCVDQVSNQPDERVGGYVLEGCVPSSDPTARHSMSELLSANAITHRVESASRVKRGRTGIPAPGAVGRDQPARRWELPQPEYRPWISPAP